MANCPHRSGCTINQSISTKEALRVWQSFYCDGSFARCERFKLADAGLSVPTRLLPNGRFYEEQEPSVAAVSTVARR